MKSFIELVQRVFQIAKEFKHLNAIHIQATEPSDFWVQDVVPIFTGGEVLSIGKPQSKRLEELSFLLNYAYINYILLFLQQVKQHIEHVKTLRVNLMGPAVKEFSPNLLTNLEICNFADDITIRRKGIFKQGRSDMSFHPEKSVHFSEVSFCHPISLLDFNAYRPLPGVQTDKSFAVFFQTEPHQIESLSIVPRG